MSYGGHSRWAKGLRKCARVIGLFVHCLVRIRSVLMHTNDSKGRTLNVAKVKCETYSERLGVSVRLCARVCVCTRGSSACRAVRKLSRARRRRSLRRASTRAIWVSTSCCLSPAASFSKASTFSWKCCSEWSEKKKKKRREITNKKRERES